ncbi:MAG: SURF1 family protein [Xanthobacteraceae bacterium]|nr:SURF1 family protein [Xanthobacteraceae bacterium]
MNRSRTRRGILVPCLVALAALLVLVGLGTWQLQRKAWKEGLIAAMHERLAAAPADLPPASQWSSLNVDTAEFRRVKFHAQFTEGRGVYVYVAGSALRDDIKEPGYFAFAPARLDDGTTVVVNRGYIPMDQQTGWPAGTTEVVGYLRWPESRPWFLSETNSASDTWFVRDQRAMAAAKGWGNVAPFYVDQESPIPPSGLPRPAALTVNLRNDHLQYAVTWFGLAAVLVGCFVAWLVTWWRSTADSGEEVRA